MVESNLNSKNTKSMYSPMYQKAKHMEFEELASKMKNAQRIIEVTPRGVKQHVVWNSVSILRWPVAYEYGSYM